MTLVSATHLYALSHGSDCKGDIPCHWCGAPAERKHVHDNPRIEPFGKLKYACRHPANAYICNGCRLFRRQSITAHYLNERFKDRQAPMKNGLWIDRENTWFLTEDTLSLLWPKLLKPPHQFSLTILTEPIPNLLHFAPFNDFEHIRADTPIFFAVNGIHQVYTIYEVGEAADNGIEGKAPGVHTLFRLLGAPPVPKQKKRVGNLTKDEKAMQKYLREVTPTSGIISTSHSH